MSHTFAVVLAVAALVAGVGEVGHGRNLLRFGRTIGPAKVCRNHATKEVLGIVATDAFPVPENKIVLSVGSAGDRKAIPPPEDLAPDCIRCCAGCAAFRT